MPDGLDPSTFLVEEFGLPHLRRDTDLPEEAVDGMADLWLRRLAEALGPRYRTHARDWAVVLSPRQGRAGERWADDAERAVTRVREAMFGTEGQPNWRAWIIEIDETERYYDYISHYHEDGEFGGSAGILLRSAVVPHVVVHGGNNGGEIVTLYHELVHDAFHELDPPLWLEEGLGEMLPRVLLGYDRRSFQPSWLGRHRAYWRSNSIQDFWSGASFSGPDEGCELSYHLAEFLTRGLASAFPGQIRTFIGQASYDDAGQAAAKRCFGCSLGERLRALLGKGDWEPNPAAWDVTDETNAEGAAPARE